MYTSIRNSSGYSRSDPVTNTRPSGKAIKPCDGRIVEDRHMLTDGLRRVVEECVEIGVAP